MQAHVYHTRLYSDKAEQILTKLYSEMANSEYGGRCAKNAADVKCVREADNEVVIKVDRHYDRLVYDRKSSDEKILQWLGWMIKQAAYKYFLKRHLVPVDVWKRDSDTIIPAFERRNIPAFSSDNTETKTDYNIAITVADLYCIYEILSGRKNIERKYNKDLVNSIRGHQRDPLSTEVESLRRQEVASIEKQYKSIIGDCNTDSYRYVSLNSSTVTSAQKELRTEYDKLIHEFNRKVEAMEQELTTKWKAKAAALALECDKKIAEINAAMAIPN